MAMSNQLDVSIDCEWNIPLERFICTVTVHNGPEVISQRSWSGPDSTPLIHMAHVHYNAQNALFRGDTETRSKTYPNGDIQLPLPF